MQSAWASPRASSAARSRTGFADAATTARLAGATAAFGNAAARSGIDAAGSTSASDTAGDEGDEGDEGDKAGRGCGLAAAGASTAGKAGRGRAGGTAASSRSSDSSAIPAGLAAPAPSGTARCAGRRTPSSTAARDTVPGAGGEIQ